MKTAPKSAAKRLISVIKAGDTKSFEKALDNLLACGGDINSKGCDDCTALMWAARNGEKAMVERLVSAGANIEKKRQ